MVMGSQAVRAEGDEGCRRRRFRQSYDDRNDGKANQRTALLREPFNGSQSLRPQSRFGLQGEDGEQRPGLNGSQARIGAGWSNKTSRRQAERGNGLAVHRKESTDGGKLKTDKEKTEIFLKDGLKYRMADGKGVPSQSGRHQDMPQVLPGRHGT